MDIINILSCVFFTFGITMLWIAYSFYLKSNKKYPKVIQTMTRWKSITSGFQVIDKELFESLLNELDGKAFKKFKTTIKVVDYSASECSLITDTLIREIAWNGFECKFKGNKITILVSHDAYDLVAMNYNMAYWQNTRGKRTSNEKMNVSQFISLLKDVQKGGAFSEKKVFQIWVNEYLIAIGYLPL